MKMRFTKKFIFIHMKSFARGLILKQRHKATRKWPFCYPVVRLKHKQNLLRCPQELFGTEAVWRKNGVPQRQANHALSIP